jgi:Domain of unknown function (DUF6316)
MKRSSTRKRQACSRTDRMFRTGDGWYFRTREGGTVGPFADELEASTQLEVYIRLANTGLLPEQEELSQGRGTANITG